MIDLRSDALTRPTPDMRRAMFEAEVGYDVFGEDPTVNRLEARMAEMLGKEAALFVPSGVMGNQLAIKTLTRPGDEMLVEADAHIFHYESGAPALLSGVQVRAIQGTRGLLDPEQIVGALRHGHDWEPRSRLLCLENTHNRAGGVVYPLDLLRDTAETAREHGLRTHLDGARLWNASAATGIDVSDYARPFDTVSVCLSKGLGAPVGSILAGTVERIRHARRYRKLFGGGMGQIGFLAAAGLYALDHHRDRLIVDHRHARRLAEGLAALPFCSVDPATVETNIVMFDVDDDAARVVDAFRGAGVLMVPFGPRLIRATTHLHISSADIDDALSAVSKVLSAYPAP